MQKRDLPYLALGILMTAVASCRAITDANSRPPAEPEWVPAAPVAIEPDSLPAAKPNVAPDTPVPLPATLVADDWRLAGSDRAGLSLRIPPAWVNLTDQLDTPAMGNRLGINLLFAADSDRTGRSVLAGKAFDRGAYVSGLVVAPLPDAADPAAALVDLVTAAAPTAVRLGEPLAVVSANGVSGVTLEVADGPVGLNGAPNDLRTRVVLFTPPAAGAADATGILLLLSASTPVWPQYAEVFDRMLLSARVFDVRPGAAAQSGNIAVRGQLTGDRDEVTATLELSVNDLWTFAGAGGRYLSLFLTPEEPQLDLALTLLGPDRQPVAHADDGFAGATESVIDVLLGQPGVYIVQVSDFFHASGHYRLVLSLADRPQYSGGGPISIGQALQGTLPANGQHNWVFQGTAGQRVSVVVEPGAAPFDAQLELYGPDGQRLVALDEGFSGDPEVLAGYELPANGEYAVLVRSFSPQGGPYTIAIDEDDRPLANFYDAGDLNYGDVRRETLQRQEAHAWFFQGRAGDHILARITPLSAALDPYIWLLDARIERVAAADAFATGEPETIELTLSADGQYIVLVRDFNGAAGDYEVALGAAPVATPENAGALSYGDRIMGVIKPDTAVAWSFNAQAGDVIDVDVVPAESSSDVVLLLQGPDGVTALEMDDASAGGSEAIRGFVVPAPGPWRLLLREFFGETANYRLSLARTR